MPKKTSDTLPKHVEVILFSFIFEVLFLKIHVCSFIGFLLLAASKSSMITVAAASWVLDDFLEQNFLPWFT
jgi:hypothetical protein